MTFPDNTVQDSSVWQGSCVSHLQVKWKVFWYTV